MPVELPSGVGLTYTQQYRRCGKPSCRLCADGGRGHGPYWYAYWREEGRIRSRYLGKLPPPGVTIPRAEQPEPSTLAVVASSTRSSLQVRTLGSFAIRRGEKPLAVERWERQKIGALFKWLLSAPGHLLARDEVVERFWPDGRPEQGMANLRLLVHRLRKALDGAEGGESALRYDGEVLALLPSEAAAGWLDTERFAVAARAAMAGREAAACRAALALYTGDYLPGDAYEEWAVERREELRRQRIAVLLHLAQLSATAGEGEEAAACLHSVLTLDRCHEPAALELMRFYAGVGRPGQSLRIYRRFTEALREDLDLEPEKETRMLARALASRQAAAPAAPVPETAPNNLPAPLTSFIGRRRELVSLRVLLRPAAEVGARETDDAMPPTRLVTLTGPGGSGKTRLALRLADWLLDEPGIYPDGIWLADLASLADPALVPKRVARALDIQEEAACPLTETLMKHLANKRLLLLLDNCEHLLDGCAALTHTLLASCPGLRILATSRAALGVPGEQPWPVPPLSLPAADAAGPVGHLLESEAARLFLERARIHRPDLTVTEVNARTIARICRQIEGIPLALELAAARMNVLSLEQIAARLDESFRLLTGGPRTAPTRQRTLRATLDWSYNLLSEPERILLRRLAVFAGGCDLDAAEAVCGGEGLAEDEVLDLLTGLIRQSLAWVDETAAAARYRLLETVRQYGQTHLTASGEFSALERRHTTFYLGVVEAAEPALTGAEQAEWLARLDREHDNLRAVLHRAREQGDSLVGLRVAGALWRFWFTRGYLSEGRLWLAVALNLPASTATDLTLMRAKALNGAGSLAYYQGDYAEALAHYEQALALYRALGNTRGVAALLGNVGLVVKEQGDYDQAARLYEDSLATYRDLEDTRGMANALNNLGIVAGDQGDYGRATALHEESLALKRTLGDSRGIVTSLNNLGAIAIDQGDYARAKVLHEESLALARVLDNRRSTVVSLHNLARIAHAQGLDAQAVDLYRQCLTLCRPLGDRISLAQALEGLASCACPRQEFHRAARLYGAAERLREAASVPARPLAAGDRSSYDRDQALVRSALGVAAVTAAWAEGRALTVDQAVELALGTPAAV
ncbi:MAG TPA: DUF6788 family protein [Chloroflexota bacterium]